MRQFLPLAVIAFLAGCGGSGSSTPSVPNPFAGSYSGTYTATGSTGGTATLTIATNGSISGQFVNPRESISGRLTGRITTDGSISGNVNYTNGPRTTLTGNLQLVSESQYRATLNETNNGQSASRVATLTRS